MNTNLKQSVNFEFPLKLKKLKQKLNYFFFPSLPVQLLIFT